MPRVLISDPMDPKAAEVFRANGIEVDEKPGLSKDEIKAIIAQRIATETVDYWLSVLEPADIWCAKVLNWPELMAHDGFKMLDMLQTVTRDDNVSVETTRSPLRIDGMRSRVEDAAPRIGEHSERIRKEFGL